MSPEDQQALQAHVDAIAALLYQDSESNRPESLKRLDGIELEVRDQILKHVSPNIGIFLSEQAQARALDASERSKAPLEGSRSRKSKPKPSASAPKPN